MIWVIKLHYPGGVHLWSLFSLVHIKLNNHRHIPKQTLCYMIFYTFFKIETDNNKQGKSEGFDNWDRPSNLTQIWFKSLIFQPMWPWNLMDNLEKQ